jgi:hypothetical protein
MSDAIVVRLAEMIDLPYIDSLQRKNAEELSFYPLCVFEREMAAGRILLALVNGEPAGYLYHGAMLKRVNIHQACIQYDLRGMLYGARLVSALTTIASSSGCLYVTCHCGSDIDANNFWRAVGFYCQSTTQGGVRRRRDVNHWRYDIETPLFADGVEPSERKQDASLWRRNHGEVKSQFMRGDAMRAYRKLLEDKDEQDVVRIKLNGNTVVYDIPKDELIYEDEE